MTCRIAATDAANWIRERHAGEGRLLIGICGPPGSGKSTLASRLAAEFSAPVVQMDGFHLPNAVLDERGLRAVKGAPRTFDGSAFVEAVRALRRSEQSLSLPAFDRAIDEPQPDVVRVTQSAPVVVIEGNYLLLDEEPWSQLAPLLDVTLYLDVDDEARVARLVARHIAFGKSPAEARQFVRESDESNAALVAGSKHRADAVVVES